MWVVCTGLDMIWEQLLQQLQLLVAEIRGLMTCLRDGSWWGAAQAREVEGIGLEIRKVAHVPFGEGEVIHCGDVDGRSVQQGRNLHRRHGRNRAGVGFGNPVDSLEFGGAKIGKGVGAVIVLGGATDPHTGLHVRQENLVHRLIHNRGLLDYARVSRNKLGCCVMGLEQPVKRVTPIGAL